MAAIRGAFLHEVCCSLVVIFEWYSFIGPAMANFLFQIHSDGGYNALLSKIPEFANLIDHIVQFVIHHRKEKTSKGQQKTLRKKIKLSIEQEDSRLQERLGPSRAIEEISSIPFDFYGLRELTKPTSGFLKIPNPKGAKILPGDKALYAACNETFQELVAMHIILPKLRVIDDFACRLRRSQNKPDSDKAYQRCITRGAILWCISNACGSDGMFASLAMEDFISSPALLFKSEHLRRPRNFVTRVLAHRDDVLRPLFDWIKGHVASCPEITHLSEQLGDLSHHEMLELCAGKSIPWTPDDATNGTRVDTMSAQQSQPKRKTARSLLQINKGKGPLPSAPLEFETLVLPTQVTGVKIGTLGLLLREALNLHKGLPCASNELGHMMRNAGSLNSSRSVPNPDHINPIREESIGVTLLLKHIPPQKFTSRHGLSNLLSWMGTGQGFRTQDFLGKISRETFYTKDFEEMTDAFDQIHKQNDLRVSEYGTKAPGLITLDDQQIYGTTNNHFSSRPTVTSERGNRQMTTQEKFAPYWTDKVQEAWVTLLGNMFEQDPSQYVGPRPDWKMILGTVKKLKINGFNTGLSLLQLSNNAVLLLNADYPNPDSVAEWIYENKDLGAYKTLTIQYGFCISSRIAAKIAFGCIYEHLKQKLSESDKKILRFSPIMVEHVLCKDKRWQTILTKNGHPDLLEMQAYKAEEGDRWQMGRNDRDHTSFPFPLTISTDLVREITQQKSK